MMDKRIRKERIRRIVEDRGAYRAYVGSPGSNQPMRQILAELVGEQGFLLIKSSRQWRELRKPTTRRAQCLNCKSSKIACTHVGEDKFNQCVNCGETWLSDWDDMPIKRKRKGAAITTRFNPI